MYTTYGNFAGYLTYNTSLKFMVLITILKRLLPVSKRWTTKILKIQILNFIAVFMNHPRTRFSKWLRPLQYVQVKTRKKRVIVWVKQINKTKWERNEISPAPARPMDIQTRHPWVSKEKVLERRSRVRDSGRNDYASVTGWKMWQPVRVTQAPGQRRAE